MINILDKDLSNLQQQITTTISRLERGEIQRTDRIFLNHILEEFEVLVDLVVANQPGMMQFADLVLEMVGSTNELVEDGLED